MFRPMILSFLILPASVVAYAQSTLPCRENTVVANVLDVHGLPIENLKKDDFRALHQGKLLNVVWAEHRDDPGARITIMLDVSGSMKGSGPGGSNKWKIARTAALEFIACAPRQARVSFMTFAADMRQKFEAPIDRQSVENWLNSPAVSEAQDVKGHTALYDAILTAMKDLGSSQSGDAIYVITDGGENASAEKKSRLEESLEKSGTRLFAFLLNGPITIREEEGVGDLYQITRRSGGFLLNVGLHTTGTDFLSRYDSGDDVVASIKASTRMLQFQIRSFYLMGIDFRASSPKLEKWQLDVLDTQDHRHQKLTMTYPYKIAPTRCLATTAER